jgi:thiosulfate reductase cytochrome b subunit
MNAEDDDAPEGGKGPNVAPATGEAAQAAVAETAVELEVDAKAEPERVLEPEVEPPAAAEAPSRREPPEVIHRHTLVVRLSHWVNALAIFIMVGSGLNIFNAHPSLYWGQKGSELDRPFLAIGAIATPKGPRGATVIGPLHFDTTGVLGLSKVHGVATARGWPSWLTIPGFQDLADARHWHFFFAWVLTINALIYLIWSLFVRHLQRDIWPTVGDLEAIPSSVADHLRLRHPTGEAAKRYNVLQRLAYLGLILLVFLMIATGLTMSPGIDAAAPWLLDVFGGRQSARSIHFFCASLIVAFVIVHLIEVVLAGPINEVRSMITGRYVVRREHA